MDFDARVGLLRQSLLDQAECFISQHFPTVRYLTGFSGSNGAVLITPTEVHLFTDGRYLTQAKVEAKFDSLTSARGVLQAAVNKAMDFKTVAFEQDHVSATEYLGFLTDSKFVSTVGIVEAIRKTKDLVEIGHISKACEITSEALEHIFSMPLIGKSELEIAAELEHSFLRLGAENRAFDSIVATGANSAVPHHQPTNREVKFGDFLKIDCGARYSGYHADLTRTVVVGQASDWQKEIYAVVAAAAAETRAAAKPGADVFELDQVARSVVSEAGYGDFFLHPTGHGVGLEIHELPFLGRKDGILRQHMLITVEPGIYLTGRGGVRIEDTLLITNTGHTNLTTVNRELQEI